MRHVHVLGIGGTFMAGLALLAREAGYRVSGQDGPLYPPMSDVLAAAGVEVHEGYERLVHADRVDQVVIGNALSRGNPAVEAVLDRGLDYHSGPDWLARHILHERWVIAVAGTHGKTTTASLVAWLLESAGLEPGFLIGGVPENFDTPARLGQAPFFVIEADEYDTAFFDKRSKFVHFRPRTLVLNNLEFDHADIFPDLAAIERQFQHLVRTVPGNGGIVVNTDDPALARVLDAGCWSERIGFGTAADAAHRLTPDGNDWQLGDWQWTPPLPGRHNAMNTAAALLAARHAGITMDAGLDALSRFKGVRRRLQWRGEAGGVQVLDDFAHHPTAIAATLEALAAEGGDGQLIAVVEPRSNTMRQGVHRDRLGQALATADQSFVLAPPDLGWDVADALAPLGARGRTAADIETLIGQVASAARRGDTVVIMSNGAFGGIHDRLLARLADPQ
ncbi:UDP-N-acetylmuramate:L-alanyl-gamma-D-glutamyl-meso-diaminopimelate ligase [Spiribacter vilamensis]|uniref:UDP-N-acetylmuramate--L-alanyl-gamma-D-glutamyl-meso-2,6-diaminoheptandioate ligase n=1 Tax=Spiribacter vilamensis TaxID=531306 RepID=A0A4Q8D2W3_9GAMM|nr:UDP-N-acetylmuramate:L-alanyl-gamma-D-glutamyl-meso-diaminopimelate ligase [Spiribacter vilamensis]RZU99692.1 UDP-N-acetylmuramate: L-alanyl-gamma-D-glutamyl-meso-diaminopimelate ligase [Spiribacter vilamensis]TVO61358.1 UDP-N-acetylmuramate:L-alanyl-gamma-D-glutamyl-meso-diaminopimelate ligase [Spiribacter vilamensis]